MTSLLKQGINVSVLGKEPEARHLVTQQPIGWKEAVELHHINDQWHVIRVID